MHPSRVLDRSLSYERLEFLGDSILGFLVARALFDRYPESAEGDLSRLRSAVVSRRSCAVVAREIGLDRMFAEQFELTEDLRRSDNVLAALIEAAIAALVLEHGLDAVAGPVLEAFESQIREAEQAPADFKTLLQEQAAKAGGRCRTASSRPTGRPTTGCSRAKPSSTACAGHRLWTLEEGRGAGCGRRGAPVPLRVAARHPQRPLALARRVPARDLHSRLQVVPGPRRGPPRAGRCRRGRAQRLRQVEYRATRCCGPRVASPRASSARRSPTMSCSEVRAAGRPAPFCEVELVFEDVAGALPGLDYEEVAITRRLHRGGEGQYLVNGATVRRTDVVELLADVGLGSGAGAVVGQGRVETILSSSPAERRSLVEEAAGLGRFKRRRHRAELKLARVAQQVERARDLEREVQKRLRPLALQASAAERAEKLGLEVRRLRAGLASIDLAELGDRATEAELRRTALAASLGDVEQRLKGLLAERERAEDQLAAVAGGREGTASMLYRLQSARERIEMRREAAVDLLERLRAPVVEPRGDDVRDQARLAEARALAVERALAEREGLPPAARALAEQGERLALSLVEVEPGGEPAVAARSGTAPQRCSSTCPSGD